MIFEDHITVADSNEVIEILNMFRAIHNSCLNTIINQRG
jgi:hypothetical protein